MENNFYSFWLKFSENACYHLSANI